MKPEMNWKLVIIMLLLFTTIGCGGPKSDVAIFMMTDGGMQQDFGDKLQSSLQKQLGESPTVNVNASSMFNMDKLVVEIAAGDNGIIIVPEEQFIMFVQQGGIPALDDLIRPEDYPQGVLEVPADAAKKDSKPEKHLYGIPLSKTKVMQEAGYKGKEVYAFVHPRAPHLDKAKQVLKVMAGK